jgi:cell division protein FtsI/penicillin-binding protein 2
MSRARRKSAPGDWRMHAVRLCLILFAICILGRLFILQVLDHGTYQALASGQHEIFRELFPERGDVLMHDLKDGTLVPIATNQQLAFVYADPRHIEDPKSTAKALGELFGYDDDTVDALEERLDKPEDPYEPIERRVDDEMLAKIIALDLKGIFYVRESSRLYPEGEPGSHVIGFLGANEDGTRSGKYGIEGYFETELAGVPGFLRSEHDISGQLIAIGDRSIQPAVDGADIVLTIDRTIEYFACDALERAVLRHGADGGSIVIVEPSTGRILAMCGNPGFNPNDYGNVSSIDVFNNPAIFYAYEPGSVFKPFTIAGGLDSGAIEPNSTFNDSGSVMIDDWPKPIMNAEGKVYGVVTMTEALEESINTAMIEAMRRMGQDTFVQYMKNFGFGVRTGIELETEMPGNISSLDLGPEIYAATATFGQGITVTPLQIAAAYGAIANGGMLKSPYIVDEIRYADGTVDARAPVDVRRVIENKTSRLLGAMLVSVVENGHGKRAGVPGYYIAGKTGTAQVPKTDGTGYEENVNIGSFAGFGPVEDPRFAMVVRIDHPRDVEWAESSAAPLFGEIASFLLQYLEVPPTRTP